ncbi:MAG: peptidase S8 and S53 subtilisin kexin sedolisin [Linnemannia elongata]|nr:MAG: peptidase S8 and S53 subtilisin kexin sedolisin [Linnemannia elongata]
MKYTLLIVALVAAVHAAPLVTPAANQRVIPDSYIVVLKDNAAAPGFKTKFDGIAKKYNGRGRAPEIVREYTAIPGFHATFDAATLKAIQANPDVAYVEQDAVVTIQGSQSPVPSWGLTRVSQNVLNLSSPYYYNDLAGSGVTAYVVDTGVYAAHSDFGGRATFGANFVSGSANTDENGHGTHVSGTIGGTKYGVAKKVSIVGVKVLDAQGSGSTSGVVAGMDWVAARAVAGKSVVNMSLGGGKSAAIDAAAARLFAKNIPLIVAAGNSANNACTGSPAGAANTYTVGATDKTDYPASFTSYGTCVEIFGPGVGITSAWIGGTSATNTISGTSMATPHVVGVAALYIAQGGLNTAQSVFDKLTSTSTKNVVKGSLGGTANRLVYNGAAN